MESKDYSQYLEKAKGNLLPLVFGLVGLILLSYGLISSLSSSAEEPEDIIFDSSNEKVQEAKIIIDIQGAVVFPGVYTLDTDGRIKDALIQAGGLSSDADREWVAKNLNQAAKLSDGSKIYIPRLNEQVQAQSTGTISTSGLININSASSSELDTLPGIGPVTANKIIDNRPYTAVEDLLTKKAVGQSVFENIKDKISVY